MKCREDIRLLNSHIIVVLKWRKWSCVQLNSQVSTAARGYTPVNCGKHLSGVGMDLE